MFGNYTNYLKFLIIRFFKIIKGEYKLYTPIEGYGSTTKVVITKSIISDLVTIHSIPLVYRVYWKDGSKSPWFIYGVPNYIGDIDCDNLLHRKEVIIKIN
jgi:hypothetical protein